MALTAGAQQAPVETVTLEQAIERALQQDPRVVQALGNTRIAAAGERSASGNYLPTLSASASSSTGGSLSPTGVGVGAGLSLGYDVFTGFRRKAQTEQAQSATQSARANLLLDRATVALGVEQVFYENLRGAELEEVARSRLLRAEEGLGAATRKATAGTGTRSDTLRAELELNTAQRDLLEARTASETSAYQLGRAIGAEGAVRASAESADDNTAFDAERVIAELMQHSPDILAAEASARSATAGTGVARSSYFPQVSVRAGTGWNTTVGGAFLPGQPSWSLGLNLSYPIFDGFRRDESMERARVQEAVAQSALSDTRRAVRTTAQQLAGQLRLAREQISLQQKSVAVAQEDLRVQQERYRLGVTTMLDLLASQSAVVQAQTDLVSAKFDYRLARANLQALLGRTE